MGSMIGADMQTVSKRRQELLTAMRIWNNGTVKSFLVLSAALGGLMKQYVDEKKKEVSSYENSQANEEALEKAKQDLKVACDENSDMPGMISTLLVERINDGESEKFLDHINFFMRYLIVRKANQLNDGRFPCINTFKQNSKRKWVEGWEDMDPKFIAHNMIFADGYAEKSLKCANEKAKAASINSCAWTYIEDQENPAFLLKYPKDALLHVNGILKQFVGNTNCNDPEKGKVEPEEFHKLKTLQKSNKILTNQLVRNVQQVFLKL